MTSEKVKETTFEEDLESLEAIVQALEQGDLPLEEALRRFEEGVRLTRACRTRLQGVEGRVAELLADGSTRTIAPSAD